MMGISSWGSINESDPWPAEMGPVLMEPVAEPVPDLLFSVFEV